MFLLRNPWRYEFVEVDDGLLIIEKGELMDLNNLIQLDELDGSKETENSRKKPWTFMVDGQEHMYR